MLIAFSNWGSRDSLKRHMAIHGHQAAQSFAANSPRMKRSARACLSCVRSKQRCIGDMPWERCSHKRARCVYPTSTPETVGGSNISNWTTSDALSIPSCMWSPHTSICWFAVRHLHQQLSSMFLYLPNCKLPTKRPKRKWHCSHI